MNIDICSLTTAVKLLPEYFEFKEGPSRPVGWDLRLTGIQYDKNHLFCERST